MTPHQSYRLNQPATNQNLTSVAAAGPIATGDLPALVKKPGFIKRLAQIFNHPQFATVGAVTACFLILAGYVTYMNYPKLALRVATAQAGFSAQLPRYTPAGYSFGKDIIAHPGQITIHLNSHNNSSQIALTQHETKWDSATLLENFVKPKGKDYLTFKQNGLTIYLYNGNSIAWVNSGVFYTLEGNNLLSSSQLIKIATSI